MVTNKSLAQLIQDRIDPQPVKWRRLRKCLMAIHGRGDPIYNFLGYWGGALVGTLLTPVFFPLGMTTFGISFALALSNNTLHVALNGDQLEELDITWKIALKAVTQGALTNLLFGWSLNELRKSLCDILKSDDPEKTRIGKILKNPSKTTPNDLETVAKKVNKKDQHTAQHFLVASYNLTSWEDSTRYLVNAFIDLRKKLNKPIDPNLIERILQATYDPIVGVLGALAQGTSKTLPGMILNVAIQAIASFWKSDVVNTIVEFKTKLDRKSAKTIATILDDSLKNTLEWCQDHPSANKEEVQHQLSNYYADQMTQYQLGRWTQPQK